MNFNTYLYEKLHEAYYQDLQHEAEKERRLSTCLGIVGAEAGLLKARWGCCSSSSVPD
jgi:hypothetical protein